MLSGTFREPGLLLLAAVNFGSAIAMLRALPRRVRVRPLHRATSHADHHADHHEAGHHDDAGGLAAATETPPAAASAA